MKRIFSIFICAVTVLGISFSVSAETSSVNDNAGLLFDVEKTYIESLIEETVEYTQLDIVIVTTDYTLGKTSQEYADDYYDENGFGVGEDYSGILLLVNMDAGDIYISTTGEAIRYFTDERIEEILDAIYEYVSQGYYYEGCEEFVKQVKEYYDKGIPSNQHTVEELTWAQRALRSLKRMPIYIICGIVIGALVVLIMVVANKGKRTVDRNTYAVQNRFKLIKQNDRFITMVHTHHRINTNNGGGGHGGGSGRSTTHTSSSGRSHGGGGRSF